MDPADEAHQVHMATQRLEVLDAVVMAQDQFAEVSSAIAASADKYAARSAVSRLLGVEDMAARAITELIWFRLTEADRRETRAERDEIIAYLRDTGTEPTWSSAP